MSSRLRAVPDAPRRAIGYVRVSMAREEMVSPELQRTAIEGYCQQQGYILGEVIEDLDRTGRNFARAGVQDAIARVERGEADVIVVWKVSRFGRNTRDWHIHADRVEVVGGSLESATESFDPRTSTGKLTRGLLVELAAWESNVKSEQWREAIEHRYRQGLTASPGPRFGYVYDREAKIHRPDPVTGPILTEAYRRYLAGQTFYAIAKWLNGTGIRGNRGATWTDVTVRQMLDTGFGAGLVQRLNRPPKGQPRTRPPEHLKGAHESVISEAEWERYLRRRKANAKEPARARAGLHPLSGLVVCDTCDHKMKFWQGSGKTAYRCTANGGCGRNYVNRDRVMAAVKAWLEVEAGADVDQRAATKAQQSATRVLARSEQTAIERKIRELDRSLARLTDGWARGIVPESAYRETSGALTAERDGLAARLDDLADEMAAAKTNARPVARSILRDFDALLGQNPSGVKEVLRALIREVRIRPGQVDEKVEVVPRWAPRSS